MSKRPVKNQKQFTAEKTDDKLPVLLEQEIEQAIEPLLQKGQTRQVVQRVTQIVTAHEAFAGPLPHPRHLREYEDILPGSAERILTMAERAQSHRQNMGKTALASSVKLSMHGMYLGVGAAILLILGAFYAGMQGNNLLAALMLGTGALAGISKLIHGWSRDNRSSD